MEMGTEDACSVHYRQHRMARVDAVGVVVMYVEFDETNMRFARTSDVDGENTGQEGGINDAPRDIDSHDTVLRGVLLDVPELRCQRDDAGRRLEWCSGSPVQ